jgi:tetratricopeptide (TPR) repeat protein
MCIPKNFKAIILLVFNFISMICFNAQSQAKEIDSISKLIEVNYVRGETNPNITLKHLTALYYTSKQAGYYKGQVYSIFEEARIYHLNGNFDAALNKINEGINIAKERKDYNSLCRILLIYQRVLLQLDHLNASKKILLKAEEYNQLISSTEDQKINNIYLLIARADLLSLNETHTIDPEVIKLKKLAYSECIKISNRNRLKKATVIFTLESLTLSLINSNEIKDSEKYSLMIDNLLLRFPDDALIIQNLIIKGHLESSSKNYGKAIAFYKLALTRSKKNNNTYRQHEIYSMIASSYRELHDFEKSADFSKKYKLLLDSIDYVKKKSGDVNFINGINQKVFETNEKKSVLNNFHFLAVITIILFIVVAVYIYLKKLNKKEGLDNNSTLTELYTTQNHPVDHSSPNLQKDLQTNVQSEDVKKLVLLAKEDTNTFYVEFQNIYFI